MRQTMIAIACILLTLSAAPSISQDGLNLPIELYILTNEGAVDSIGLGAAGINTVTPTGDFVIDFGVAPDGNWIAYRTEAGLWLANMFNRDEMINLEGERAGVPSIRGRGQTIQWAPGGDALAFTTEYGARIYFNTGSGPIFTDIGPMPMLHLSWSPDGSYLAGEAEDDIWWIYQRDGTAMTLVSALPSSRGTAWLDPGQLLFAPAEGGLSLMDIASGNQQRLLLNDSWLYYLPYRENGGTFMAFGRDKNDSTIDDGFARPLRVSIGDGGANSEPVGDVAFEMQDLRWAPGGKLLLAFRGGVLALVDPISGQGFTLPITNVVAYGWGPTGAERVDGITLPVNGYFLAADLNGVVQVWQLPRDGSEPFSITTAETDVSTYVVAADGRSVVYISDEQLWLQQIPGDDAPEMVVELSGDVRRIDFSPDGQRIAYDRLSSATNAEDDGIWLLSASDGEIELVLPNGLEGSPEIAAPPFYREPQFSPNINGLLVIIAGSETTNYGLYDLSSGELLNIGAYDAAQWASGGTILAYGNGIGIGDLPPFTEIKRIDLTAPDEATSLTAIAAPLIIRSISEMNDGTVRIAVTENVLGPSRVRVVATEAGGGDLTAVADTGFLQSPRLSPDGTYLAGFTNPRGSLIVHNLDDGSRLILNSPSSVWDFQWGRR